MEQGKKLESGMTDLEKGYLRPVEKEDMDLLFEWANEAEVRRNSFSVNEISYEEHKSWFEKLLKDKNCRQYIYLYDGKATGQIRLDVYGKTAKISYSICARLRGQGHGRRMLELVCRQVKKDFPQVLELEGKVKPENTASGKAFEKTGFRIESITYKKDVGKLG